MSITKDRGRQNVLSAKVPFTFADFTSGVAVEVIDIPGGAYIIDGELVIETVFNSGTSDGIEVGDSNGVATLKSNTNAQTAARGALVPTGGPYAAKDAITLEWTGVGAAPTTGAGFVRISYVIDGRANEVQP